MVNSYDHLMDGEAASRIDSYARGKEEFNTKRNPKAYGDDNIEKNNALPNAKLNFSKKFGKNKPIKSINKRK